MTKIAAGLEATFARHGFAKPSVEDLRVGAGVSLRTLYKYAPSREEMILTALEHRHQRYLETVFTGLPQDRDAALETILDRVGQWMAREAAHGCLFHAAVAAAPDDARLHALLVRHKSEVATHAAQATQLVGAEIDLTLILEGLMQSWPQHRQNAVDSAKRLSKALKLLN